MVAGTVTDRFGATAELCDRDSECKLVTISADPTEEDPTTLIDEVTQKLNSNQMTGMQAVDEVTFAVQALQAEARAASKKSDGKDNVEEDTKELEGELITVLDIVKRAAKDALGTKTQQTPRLQGLFASPLFCT